MAAPRDSSQKLRSMTILVTGGAGFIGRHLVKALLDRNYDVRVLDNLSEQVHGSTPWPPWEFDAAEFVRADVRDRAAVTEALKGVDRVVHLAALTGVGQSMYEVERYTAINEGGTAVLLQAVVDAKRPLQRFVLASSRAVYGEGLYDCPRCGIVSPAGRLESDLARSSWDPACPSCGGPIQPIPTAETTTTRPRSVYAANKLAQEHLCRVTCEAYGTVFVALRYFNVYGPGQSLINPYTGILSTFAMRLEAGDPIDVFEDGQESRDFVYIDDVVTATLAALLAPAEQFRHDTYNVGTGASVTIAQLAQVLIAARGRVVPVQTTGGYRVGDVRHAVADTRRAEADLRFSAATGIEPGIRAWLSWASEQLPTDRTDLPELATTHLLEHNLYREAMEMTTNDRREVTDSTEQRPR